MADWPAHASLQDWRAAAPDEAPAGPAVEGMAGTCVLCGRATRFEVAAGADTLRETARCARCGCNARQRAAAAVLLDALDGLRRPRVYLTEQASPLFVALARRIPGLRGSEFGVSLRRRVVMALWLARQGLPRAIRREDVTALGFDDATLDAIGSFDVLEHVPDHRTALREFARVLRPGGTLVMTIPFYAALAESRRLAEIGADGRIRQLVEPPEFHGDPRGGGVLCFHHLGWDLLDALRAAGFSEAAALRVRDDAQGLPEPLWVLRARR